MKEHLKITSWESHTLTSPFTKAEKLNQGIEPAKVLLG